MNTIHSPSIFRLERQTIVFSALLVMASTFFGAMSSSHAATLDITVASGNISPIAKVVLDDNGTIVTQTSSQSGVIATRATELNLVSVELVSGVELTEFSVGLDVVLQGFATWQPTSGIGVLNSDGTQTNLVAGAANIEAFRLAALDTISNSNLNNYIFYDGIQPSAPPSGTPDFDIIYQVPFLPDDYILVQERNGNTFFELTPLDVNGDPIAGANTLRFDSQYDWNTGYANSSYQSGQPYEFSVTLASNFFVGTSVTPQPVYGFRIDNDGQADVKFFLLSDDPFPPPPTNDPSVCYAMADSADRLVSIRRTSPYTFTDIGGAGTSTMEALTISPDGNTLYGAHISGGLGFWGTLNASTGAFTQVTPSTGIGTANGDQGAIVLADIDGLAIDYRSGVFYGSARLEGGSNPEDLLFVINPDTGVFVPDFFGAGVDYVTIDTSVVGLADVDDIAVDPTDGQMYAVANNAGGNDRLIRVNKLTGAVTDVGRLRTSGGTNINDMEAFSFYNDGTFYGTTGNGGNPANSFWQIDPATGIVTLLATFPSYSDYEGVACLTGGTNIISGKVFEDNNADGTFNGTDTGTQDVTVRLYIDENNDGVWDSGDTLIQTQETDGSGDYLFEVPFAGNFVIDIDVNDLPYAAGPMGAGLTTDNIEEADFVGFTGSDINNNFGWAPLDLQIVKTASPNPVVFGKNLTYTLTVTNNGPRDATNVMVTDTLPSSVTHVSTTPSQGSCSGTTVISCNLGTMADGDTETVTIVVTVN